MQTLLISGGRLLCGEVRISGSKNAVLPMLASTVLFSMPCRLRNCPDLTDVDAAVNILSYLGAVVRRDRDEVFVDPRPICRWRIPSELMCSMRGTLFFAGPLLARFGRCRLVQPGGCPLGERPVDYHIRGFLALGAQKCPDEPGVYRGELKGCHIELPYPSVGTTENLIMAALGASGETCITNAAREPEIENLCDFLRSGGCSILGDGTSRIVIQGGLPREGDFVVMPDRMECATFACAVVSAGGEISMTGADDRHLTSVFDVLEKSGCRINRYRDGIRLKAGELRAPGLIQTEPYPGFPTDAQAPVMGALLRAEGITTMIETVFSDRMKHIHAMNLLGADITCRGDRALIRGVDHLRGSSVIATDLRAAAGISVAALAAEGMTQLHGLHHLMRGYEDFAGKLCALGAEVRMA